MGKEILGEFEFLVLLAALRLGADEAVALTIVKELAARTGLRPQRAAVYTTLRRLESKGLIESRLGEPRPERGGKARRHVSVTARGLEAARASQRVFQSMWTGLDLATEAG